MTHTSPTHETTIDNRGRVHCSCGETSQRFGTLSLARRWERDHRREARAESASRRGPGRLDLVQHLLRQREFSLEAFGPGDRREGVLDHMLKEMTEVRRAADRGEPTLPEWVDLILLALDGAWRSGAEPWEVAAAVAAKQRENESRTWPDWRTAEPGTAIEHVRDSEPPQIRDANGDVVSGVEGDATAAAFFAGRVPAPDCPHYIAASEAAAGFTRCEHC